MKQQHIDQAWFQSQAIPAVTFIPNDPVSLSEDENQPIAASRIALLHRQPEPLSRVELGTTGIALELPEQR